MRAGVTVNNDNHNDTHQDNRKDNESYRRIELITGTTRRRRWSDDERARILAESFEPGANISAVARRHGVHGGLCTLGASKPRRGLTRQRRRMRRCLFQWRSPRRAAAALARRRSPCRRVAG